MQCFSFECRERSKFHKKVRQNEEAVKEFIFELQKQAGKCHFGNRLETELRDRLVTGINISILGRELIQKPGSSFQEIKTA